MTGGKGDKHNQGVNHLDHLLDLGRWPPKDGASGGEPPKPLYWVVQGGGPQEDRKEGKRLRIVAHQYVEDPFLHSSLSKKMDCVSTPEFIMTSDKQNISPSVI